ncbi:hypothetical protein GCM10023328_46330 [Modestobacter marinus]|uniref:Uncharacterized protein n=1 Tax=Modestobacter marinus TaxID=477641 RepID=A0ABQ2FY73_9ACTN|nr:hypothetical protein GCM10011589_21760 [Modestobacter marinus]
MRLDLGLEELAEGEELLLLVVGQQRLETEEVGGQEQIGHGGSAFSLVVVDVLPPMLRPIACTSHRGCPSSPAPARRVTAERAFPARGAR